MPSPGEEAPTVKAPPVGAHTKWVAGAPGGVLIPGAISVRSGGGAGPPAKGGAGGTLPPGALRKGGAAAQVGALPPGALVKGPPQRAPLQREARERGKGDGAAKGDGPPPKRLRASRGGKLAAYAAHPRYS